MCRHQWLVYMARYPVQDLSLWLRHRGRKCAILRWSIVLGMLLGPMVDIGAYQRPYSTKQYMHHRSWGQPCPKSDQSKSSRVTGRACVHCTRQRYLSRPGTMYLRHQLHFDRFLGIVEETSLRLQAIGVESACVLGVDYWFFFFFSRKWANTHRPPLGPGDLPGVN
jgi:hypothetical protein